MVKEFSGDVYLNGFKLSTMVAFVIDPFFPVCRSSILEDILVAPFFFPKTACILFINQGWLYFQHFFFMKNLLFNYLFKTIQSIIKTDALDSIDINDYSSILFKIPNVFICIKVVDCTIMDSFSWVSTIRIAFYITRLKIAKNPSLSYLGLQGAS